MMLETDCKIPTQPIQVKQEPYQLHGTALAVYNALQAGQHKRAITKSLNLDEEEWTDVIFEIRKAGKKPCGVSKPFKLSDEDKIEICLRVMSGEKKTKIANDYGVAVATVIYTEKRNSGRPEIMEKKEQIEQRILADAAAGKSVTDIAVETGWTYQTVLQTIKDHEAEPVTEPDGEWIAVEETAAEPEPLRVPDAVFDAVAEKLADIERKIETNEAHIRTIQNQNEFLRERMNELQTWVEAVR